MNFNVDIGSAIKKGMRNKRWTQRDLAQIMGVSQALINAWATNKQTPQADDLLKIALLLDIVDDLFPQNLRQKFISTGTKEKIFVVESQLNDIENNLCDQNG